MTPVWSEETIHDTCDSFFEGLLEEIAHAAKTIDFEMYIFEGDALGLRVAEALASAAGRGVGVRVLVDGIGSRDWPGEPGKILTAASVESRVYNPLPWSLLGRLNLWRHPGNFLSAMRNMNRRDHRKVCVIDGRSAWLGSMNVSVCSLRAVRGAEAWHECGVRVAGQEVEVFSAAFEYAWDRILNPIARFRDRARQASRIAIFREARLVRINSPLSIRRRNMRELVMKIRAARRRVWIETPYFIPTLRLVLALRAAAISGTDVRLVLPAHSDIFYMPWVIPAILERLVRRGLRVFAYTPTTLHAKIMMIDDWATVGSSNLNRRSLIHDLEIDAVIVSPTSIAALEERFRGDFAHADEVTATTIKARPLLHKILGRILMPLRHWM